MRKIHLNQKLPNLSKERRICSRLTFVTTMMVNTSPFLKGRSCSEVPLKLYLATHSVPCGQGACREGAEGSSAAVSRWNFKKINWTEAHTHIQVKRLNRILIVTSSFTGPITEHSRTSRCITSCLQGFTRTLWKSVLLLYVLFILQVQSDRESNLILKSWNHLKQSLQVASYLYRLQPYLYWTGNNVWPLVIWNNHKGRQSLVLCKSESQRFFSVRLFYFFSGWKMGGAGGNIQRQFSQTQMQSCISTGHTLKERAISVHLKEQSKFQRWWLACIAVCSNKTFILLTIGWWRPVILTKVTHSSQVMVLVWHFIWICNDH